MYTVSEVAAEAKTSTATIIRHIKAGRLKAINLACGSRRADYRILKSDLDDFIESQRVVVMPKYSCSPRRKASVGKDHFPGL
jgi:excisionase family DNA binding protein